MYKDSSFLKRQEQPIYNSRPPSTSELPKKLMSPERELTLQQPKDP
jgi:hypothetical protein